LLKILPGEIAVSTALAVSFTAKHRLKIIIKILAYGTTQNAMLKLVNRFEDTTTFK